MSQFDEDKKSMCLDQMENKQAEHNNHTIKYQLLHSGEPVVLNVGGVKYYTSLSTLSANTESIFYKYFNGEWSLLPCKDGSYFYDRNGELFKYVLEYLRNNKLIIADDTILINSLICEAEYYQLAGLKSELLIQKTKSAVLKKGDVEFIKKSFDEGLYKLFGKPFEILHQHLIYSYNGDNCIDYDNLYGLNHLLFLLCSEDNDRFGFYIHGIYDKQNETDGFIFDLDSELTGKRCVWKNYDFETLQFTIADGDDDDDDIMFDAVISYGDEEEDLVCTLYNIYGSFNCYCRDENRTVFTKSIKRLEIFRIL